MDDQNQPLLNDVAPAVGRLGALASRFPNISSEQRKLWEKDTRNLTNMVVPSFKFAFIGKTGCGKSTLINCLLEVQILPASAEVFIGSVLRGVASFTSLSSPCSSLAFPSACTSAVTEVSYRDSDNINASIIFISADEWREEVERLLDVVTEEDEEDRTSSSSDKKLCMKPLGLPSVRGSRLLKAWPLIRYLVPSLSGLSVESLAKMPYVQEKLGTTVAIPPSDPDVFRTISIYRQNQALHKVEICGNFEVLSSGITLVDLPGHGDDDDTRNKFAEEYMKNADGVVLVVDAKRARDDRDTLAYLRKTLSQLLLDRREVTESVLLAVTGTDISIGDNEIKLEGHAKVKLDGLIQKGKDLQREIPPHTRSPSTRSPISKLRKVEKRPEVTVFSSKISTATPVHDFQRGAEVGAQIRANNQEKLLLLANARISSVRNALDGTFVSIYRGMSPAGSKAPKMPIFCLGSRDYISIKLGQFPLTEIPAMQAHLLFTGERRRLKWATTRLAETSGFSERVHTFFAGGFHLSRLPEESRRNGLNIVNELKTKNEREANDVLDSIKEELDRIERELATAVERAAGNSLSVMTEFSVPMRWNTFKCCMKLNGIYKQWDMNRALTKTVISDIQGSWNHTLNHRIPDLLGEAFQKMEEHTLDEVSRIVEALNPSATTLTLLTATARRSLGIDGAPSKIQSQCDKFILFAQRDGTRSLQQTVQQRLTPMYKTASLQQKTGCYKRMKDLNEAHMTEHGPSTFNAINTYIHNLLDTALGQELIDLIRITLIDSVKLKPEDAEAKDEILRLILDQRPALQAMKIELAARTRALADEDVEMEDARLEFTA
ncbi:hypothetical protein B0H17DRAFT_1300923 [Mycena rosella]|uniref:Dynamin N-terminal domain-containing protein n=1 Tax=Mycena rosella TaxID=1033263 RepID=A0AAD7DBH3_MYCRO|nr:hypothetical protein B0H17DRAFT_1300923 [Mycena rosella]